MRIICRVIMMVCLLTASLAALTSCVGTAEPKTYTLEYIAGEGGSIVGARLQVLEGGNNGTEVVAKADSGYVFSHWSDGLLADTRLDKNVQQDITLTAVFAKIDGSVELTVKYIAGEGGTILEGETHTISYGQSLTVTAKADTGYEFSKWSDGKLDNPRTDENITNPVEVYAIFIRILLEVRYCATDGGTIVGKTEQSVYYGCDAEMVTAVPDEGFVFIKWADSSEVNSTRIDTNITNEINAVAEFEEKEKVFNYVYNKATANNTDISIHLLYSTLNETHFLIPIRTYYIFNGWYLDSDFSIKVSDEQGNFLLDYSIFECPTDSLYAKWTVAQEIHYKILMVFVTEINATLSLDDYVLGEKKHVYYKMSDEERQFCELIPMQVQETLNQTFDGLVSFDVDAFFTTTTVDESSFEYNSGVSGAERGSLVYAYNIPEVGPMLKDYRSIITTICLNDPDAVLRGGANGWGSEKYACVFLEAVITPAINLNNLKNLQYEYWNYINYLYLHEFTHTIEQATSVYEHRGIAYHVALNSYESMDHLEITKLYLLNQAKANEKTVGIPYFFWNGEIEIYVRYVLSNNSLMGGYINGKSAINIYVPFGGTAQEITAVANYGYRFVKWSDGITTATRHDTNIISRLIVYAIFERV